MIVPGLGKNVRYDAAREVLPALYNPNNDVLQSSRLVVVPGFICVGHFLMRVVVDMERFKGFFEGTLTFLREVVGELRKVIWPTRERIVKLTGVVVAMVAVVSGFLYLWDLGLGALMNALFSSGVS